MILSTSVDTDIRRAAHRAFVHNLTAQLAGVQRVGVDATEFYDVASFSTAGLMHRVRLDFTVDGIDAACDCTAGQNGRICAHIAAALQASETLGEPEPDPTPMQVNWFKQRMAEGRQEREELYRVAR